MAIRITCPGCQTALTLDDAMRGKKVRCKACEKVLSIPAAPRAQALAPAEEPEDHADQNEPRVKLKRPAAPSDADSDVDDDDRPAKKKKKKKKGKKGSGALLIGGVAALVLLLLAGGGYFVAAALIRQKPDEQKQKQDQQAAVDAKAKKDADNANKGAGAKERDNRTPARMVVPDIKEGNPAKQGGFVGGIRAAGYVTERKNELGQLGKAFNQFALEYNGAARTQENFLEYIKTFGPIRDSVKDGFYIVNMKAEPLSSTSIIAYEHEKYGAQGYLCVRGDCSVDHVPEAAWKAALGK